MNTEPTTSAPPIAGASVKVMRSHDYCHFEVNLSASGPVTLAEVDALRKDAARLVDKAVEQYKKAKEDSQFHERWDADREWKLKRIDSIREKPEADRTPQDLADLKAWDDGVHRDSRRYDYQDDWDDYDDN
jgi:hypothetical protein